MMVIINQLPEYVFRGSTLDFEGGSSSKKLGYTCTTRHPAKAPLFALECAIHFPDKAVIYIAESCKLVHLTHTCSVLKKEEEKVAFNILPMDFYSLVEGYIFLKDMQKILKSFKFNLYEIVGVGNLTRLCKETKPTSLSYLPQIKQGRSYKLLMLLRKYLMQKR